MKLSKPLGIITGLAVAVGSISPFCCSFSDIPVHADFGNFDAAVDYGLSATGSDAEFILTPGGAFVAGALIGIYMCTQSPLPAGVTDLNAENISFASGYYTLNGSLRTGYIASYSDSSGSVSYVDSRIPMIYATDYKLTVVNSSDITFGSTQFNVDSNGSSFRVVLSPYSSTPAYSWIVLDSSQSIWESGTYGGFYASGGYLYAAAVWNVSGMSVPELGGMSTDTLVRGLRASGGTTLLKQTPFNDSLPAGTIDLTNPQGYIDNVFRPYVEINYPDYIYLLPEPEPEPPQYATDDIVPGIPKDWTIINPDLPEIPTIDFTIPDADFSVLNPSEAIDDYSDGLGFWWALTDDFLSTSDLRWLVLLGLSLAILAYILWMLGR